MLHIQPKGCDGCPHQALQHCSGNVVVEAHVTLLQFVLHLLLLIVPRLLRLLRLLLLPKTTHDVPLLERLLPLAPLKGHTPPVPANSYELL